MIEISVIVTAYNRKEFLKDALESLNNQTLEKNKFEVILITNFEYNTYENLNGVNLKHIIMDGSLGKFLHRGIAESRGEIITFLDDDDKFSNTKLERVFEVFSSRKEIIYLHNAQEFIDRDSNLLERPKNFPSFPNDLLLRSDQIDSVFKTLKEFHLDLQHLFFNLSSVSVARKIFDEHSNEIKKLLANPDDLIFYVASASRGELFFTKTKLTMYRVHNSTSNVIGGYDDQRVIEQRKKHFNDIILSQKLFLDIIKNPVLNSYETSKLTYYQALLYKIEGKALDVFKQMIRIVFTGALKKIPKYKMRDRLKIYLGLSIFSIFYPLSLKMKILQKFSRQHPHSLSLRKFS